MELIIGNILYQVLFKTNLLESVKTGYVLFDGDYVCVYVEGKNDLPTFYNIASLGKKIEEYSSHNWRSLSYKNLVVKFYSDIFAELIKHTRNKRIENIFNKNKDSDFV